MTQESLERAVAGIGLVDASGCAGRNERGDDVHEFGAALVSGEVHLAAGFDEALPGLNDVRCAGRVVAEVEGRCPDLTITMLGPG